MYWHFLKSNPYLSPQQILLYFVIKQDVKYQNINVSAQYAKTIKTVTLIRDDIIVVKLSSNTNIMTCVRISVSLSANSNRPFYGLLSYPADYIRWKGKYRGCLMCSLYWNPFTDYFKKWKKTRVFFFQLRVHAYHNNDSAPSNGTISRAAGAIREALHATQHEK